jgi:hypothetical protein
MAGQQTQPQEEQSPQETQQPPMQA